MVIKMENDFDGSTPTCEKPKKSFSCASHSEKQYVPYAGRTAFLVANILFRFFGYGY